MNEFLLPVKGNTTASVKENYPVNQVCYIDELVNPAFFTVIDFAN